MINKLKDLLVDIQTKSPVLLLNDAAKIFEMNYSKKIIYFNQNFSEELNNFDKNELIVVRVESSFLQPTLKVLNNYLNDKHSRPPIIILSDDIQDNIKELIEVKTVIKFSNEAKSKFLPASEALEKLKSENIINISKFYAEESPELYYLRNKSNMNKYIDLLSKC